MRTYIISTGHLVLEHNYPRAKTEPPTISVDINALLESVTSEELCVGAWINVLGYVRNANHLPPNGEAVASGAVSKTRAVYVEGIMIFPAGPVALGEYERILREARNVDRRLGRLS